MKHDHSEMLREARDLAAAIHPDPDPAITSTPDTCRAGAAMLCTLAYIIETYESRYADILHTYAPLVGGIEGSREASFGGTTRSTCKLMLSRHQEQRIRRLAFRLSEYNPSDDDAFYDAAVAHITEFVQELNQNWETHIEASRHYGEAVQSCQCGSQDLSVSKNEPIKCGKCGVVRKM